MVCEVNQKIIKKMGYIWGIIMHNTWVIDLYLVSDAERNLSLLLSQEQDNNYTQFHLFSDNSGLPKTYPNLP